MSLGQKRPPKHRVLWNVPGNQPTIPTFKFLKLCHKWATSAKFTRKPFEIRVQLLEIDLELHFLVSRPSNGYNLRKYNNRLSLSETLSLLIL